MAPFGLRVRVSTRLRAWPMSVLTALLFLAMVAATLIATSVPAWADPPVVTTGDAVAQGTGATVTGTVSDTGLSPSVSFSTDPSLAGATTVAARTTGNNGAGTDTVAAELIQLQLGTDYYYRVQASDQTETTCGEIKKLHTWSLVLKLKGKVKIAPNHSPRPQDRLWPHATIYFRANNDLLFPLTGTVTITGSKILGNRAQSQATRAGAGVGPRFVRCRAKVGNGKASCRVRLRPGRWRFVGEFVGPGQVGSGVSSPWAVRVRGRERRDGLGDLSTMGGDALRFSLQPLHDPPPHHTAQGLL